MSDGPSKPSVEGDAGVKPSIAEVAAWLRRAAESRDGVEDLRPLRRAASVPSPFVEAASAPPGPAVGEEAPHDRIVDDEPPPPSEEPASEEPASEEPAEAVAVEAPTGEAPTGEVPRDQVPSDQGTVLAPTEEAPLDEPSREESRVWGAPVDEVPVASERRDDGGSPPVTDAPVDHAPPAGTPSSATLAAAPEPEPEVPVVSPAMALFASAVVKHNTAEVAVVTETEEDLPRVEALVDEELPLAVGEEVGAGTGRITTPLDDPEPDADPGPDPDAEPDAEPDVAVEAPTGRSLASLFDLDLAELAARARGRAEERALATPPASSDVDRLREDLEAGSIDETPASAAGTGGGPAPVEARSEPVDTSGLDLSWDIDSYQPVEDLREDGEEAGIEAPAEGDGAPGTKAPAAAALAAALARRRAKRKRYPRGQLKERIGFLRRVRAMLGVVVLTIVLGVAAGAAIGAFLLFLAFAVRSAITSS